MRGCGWSGQQWWTKPLKYGVVETCEVLVSEYVGV